MPRQSRMKSVFLTLILLFGATAAHELSRSKRLTAFGKSPSNPSTQPPLVGKGKECKSNQECAHIVYSSCKVDDRDSRKRCICNDGSPIKNGQCVNRPRGLRETCKNDGECLEGGECKINPNATTAAGRIKVCLCREGRIELSNQCNGSERSVETSTVLLAIGILSVFLAKTRIYEQ